MKTLLVFGIGGFVGPYLAKEFKQSGYRVIGSDIPEHLKDESFLDAYYPGNILDVSLLKEMIAKVKPTHIVNLAAISSVGLSWKNPELTMQINVNGTLNIFEACLSNNLKPKILLIGSSEEYVVSKEPIDESTPIDANNPYGKSKIAQEQAAKDYREKYAWDIHCVRAFNHIGVGQRDNFVISSWCKQVAEIQKGLKEPILKVGNLKVKRDFSDVRDIVHAYRLVIENGNPNVIYNVGSGNAIALNDLVNHIVSLSDKQIKVEVNPELLRPNDNEFICANVEKIHNDLGWKVTHNIYDTIEEIYKDYLK